MLMISVHDYLLYSSIMLPSLAISLAIYYLIPLNIRVLLSHKVLLAIIDSYTIYYFLYHNLDSYFFQVPFIIHEYCSFYVHKTVLYLM